MQIPAESRLIHNLLAPQTGREQREFSSALSPVLRLDSASPEMIFSANLPESSFHSAYLVMLKK
jgi:hypothetical protein